MLFLKLRCVIIAKSSNISPAAKRNKQGGVRFLLKQETAKKKQPI
jgi:hypothetical protein